MTSGQITKSFDHDKTFEIDRSTSTATPLAKNEDSIFDIIDLENRELFDPIQSPHRLANQLQDAVDKIVQHCPDVDWNEDFLSYQVVRAIRCVLGGYIFSETELPFHTSKFDVEAYKLTGQAEQTHGDIAIVVSRSFYNGGHPIAGVGFYEAKASSLDGMHYPAFSFQQLRRLVTSTPKLSYLLYDKYSYRADTQEWPTLPEKVDTLFRENQFHVRSVDANFIKQYRNLSNAAYLMGQSFGYHFVQKILSGRELDYSRPPVDTIRRWLQVTRRTTALVITIAVREDENDPAHEQLSLPGFEKFSLPGPSRNDIYRLPGERPRLQGPTNSA